MPLTIDYYFAPQSPYAYLGHARFVQMAQAAKVAVNVLPVDLGGVFPVSGGLPLAKRAPQRQAYRLLELRRFSEWLKLPLNPQPQFFPVSADESARLIIAVAMKDSSEAALQLAGAVHAAVWAQERHIADDATLVALLTEQGLDPARLENSRAQEVQAQYQKNTAQAIAAGVFGVPSYVIDGEIFWGQDRLDFVQRRLMAG
jgi:2-hydroxychromene-2-carboxylate isomerase